MFMQHLWYSRFPQDQVLLSVYFVFDNLFIEITCFTSLHEQDHVYKKVKIQVIR